MTNACKFKEVFGIAPDIEVMMLECPSRGEVCQWKDGDACHCDDWWNTEYKEPTTKKDLGVDCISRAALIERINNAEEQFKYDNMETIGSDDGDPFVDGVLSGVWNIREMVKQAPSVTPQEPKTGYWYRQTNDYVDFYECSECGMATGIYDVKNYCPNCGSRNEVEDADSN